ncbi:MAG: hypothetical protein Q4B70_17770 [Lachnospiraceae bacterium]|nr:hypothetical protein [Lachnospiraceae bacterium]
MSSGNTDTLLHEVGHFVNFLTLGTVNSTEFKSIYNSEKDAAKKFYRIPSYTTGAIGEYYAESFRMYYTDNAKLKSKCPKTYNFMVKTINSIDNNTIQHTKDVYGL